MKPKSISQSSERVKAPGRRDAWMRWVNIWHIAFYVSLALPTVLTFFTGALNYSIGLIVGLSIFLGFWYALVMMWLVPKAQGKRQAVLSVIFLVVGLPVWFFLGRGSWAYYLTASSFYGLMWGTLPFSLAITGNVILTAMIVLSQALNLGKPITLSVEFILIIGMVVGWSVLLALWIRSIMRESAGRKRLIEQLEETQRSLSAVERQAGILEERQRLAQEIHDTLAQGFTSIIMQLEAADQALPQEQGMVRSRLLQARETARASLSEARRLVQALRPGPLEGASLPEAMARVVDRWRKESGTPVTFSVTGNSCPLLPEIEASLLRLMQEGLANIRKHARAHQVAVTLSYMEDQVSLDVHDDGVGFDPEHLPLPNDQGRGGFGLQTMRERVSQFGGQMIIESTPGQGTTLAVQIPVEV